MSRLLFSLMGVVLRHPLLFLPTKLTLRSLHFPNDPNPSMRYMLHGVLDGYVGGSTNTKIFINLLLLNSDLYIVRMATVFGTAGRVSNIVAQEMVLFLPELQQEREEHCHSTAGMGVEVRG
ncbi:uncharacterized protein EDB93DRAFT_1101183 [Suillus bovinus]|uniref:uncharacterized protein n=1 Tax=Suillus bovinus TaxID=48563 RepID=UPI001B885137|nr:uncharacterized protein EDB93DRAFT_1101183 [Suillus bovinus]KAG2156746.1 hypothetical protein EDB93DRAFT_1101183 [Suillus bovinus]